MIESLTFEILDQRVKLYRVHPELKATILGHLIPILISDQFFSISQSFGEFSFFTSQIRAVEDTGFVCHTHEQFCVIKISACTPLIQESGIVSWISKLFAAADIPIVYLNSYANNYVLFPEDCLEDVQDLCAKKEIRVL